MGREGRSVGRDKVWVWVEVKVKYVRGRASRLVESCKSPGFGFALAQDHVLFFDIVVLKD